MYCWHNEKYMAFLLFISNVRHESEINITIYKCRKWTKVHCYLSYWRLWNIVYTIWMRFEYEHVKWIGHVLVENRDFFVLSSIGFCLCHLDLFKCSDFIFVFSFTSLFLVINKWKASTFCMEDTKYIYF